MGMQQLKFRDSLGIVLALLAVYLIWGSTYFAIRVALEGGFPPLLMAGVRFVLAGSALFAVLWWRGASVPRAKEWLGAALIGTLLLIGGNGGVVIAEQWVASGLAALGVATVPVWTALLGGLGGRWPRRLEWAGLALGFAGVVLLNLEGDLRASPVGALALFIAALSWSLGSTWSQRVALPAGLMASAAEMLVAGGLFLVLGLVRGERVGTMPHQSALLALLYLIVFGALVAFTAYNYLLRRVRPALATSYAYVNPVVAVGLGVGFADERITSVGLAAMLVIVAGVALLAWGKKDARRPARTTPVSHKQPT